MQAPYILLYIKVEITERERERDCVTFLKIVHILNSTYIMYYILFVYNISRYIISIYCAIYVQDCT